MRIGKWLATVFVVHLLSSISLAQWYDFRAVVRVTQDENHRSVVGFDEETGEVLYLEDPTMYINDLGHAIYRIAGQWNINPRFQHRNTARPNPS